ncbi:hypothetical protein L2E82_49209 [Cichorium intybus]|uniref:Uncharacterized protein n=1 Tax=Cichorium intybus TaxID=13427 RepID=A0ACB8YZY4_CICIN|nr:hypothetical protein L2E82_49209 [Cichorium intybus]
MVSIPEFDFNVESDSDGLILLRRQDRFYLYNPAIDMLETLPVFLKYSPKLHCELVLAYDRDKSVNSYKVVYFTQEIGKRNEYDIRVFSSADQSFTLATSFMRHPENEGEILKLQDFMLAVGSLEAFSCIPSLYRPRLQTWRNLIELPWEE